jgi:hypothetical protein
MRLSNPMEYRDQAESEVAGVPVQRESEGHPYIEIPLLRGDWLVVDYDRKYVRLR